MNQSPRYPLGETNPQSIKAASGRPFEAINLTNLMEDQLSPEDLRIHAATLLAQAEIAQQAGYDRVAENLSRAAELTRVPNSLLMTMYEALRPGRSNAMQLSALAEQLEREFNAPCCAGFVRQASEVYHQRGLLKDS